MNAAKLPTAEPLTDSLTVADAMHHGIVTCPPTASLREVAAAMAENGIHCVVVADGPAGDGERSLWGIVSDVDLMRGLGSPVELTAGNLTALDVVTISPADALAQAVRLMADHDVAHLIVVADGRPVGVLSTQDVANAIVHAE